MAPRTTRSKRQSVSPSPSESSMPPLTTGASRLMFVLPKSLSTEARIITLSNPANARSTSYVFCPTSGLYEITQTSSPNQLPRSWILSPPTNPTTSNAQHADGAENVAQNVERYTQTNADIFTATPMDPLFVLTPLFCPHVADYRSLYRMEDDHLEKLAESNKRIHDLIGFKNFRESLVSRLRVVSETQEVGDETAFKPSIEKFLKELLSKAHRMADAAVFPKSMAECLVRKQLEVPVIAQSRVSAEEEVKEAGVNEQPASEILPELFAEESNKQPAESPRTVDDPSFSQIESLLRIRTALNYMIASYTPPAMREELHALLKSNKHIDFTPLDTRLEHIKKIKSDIVALRSMSDNISRKRSALEDDEAAEARAEKKRKKEEEEKKKKAESRALKDLKKVDTSGMKKLSSFFSKPATG